MTTCSSSTCSYRVFEINAATTIEAVVQTAGLTYRRGAGYYRKI